MKDGFILIVLLMCCSGLYGSENLLLNGGAESGTVEGWEYENVAVYQRQTESVGVVIPSDGDYFFSMGPRPATYGFMLQSGQEGLDQSILVLSGMVQTEDLADDDYGRATISVYDSNEALLATVSSDILTTENLQWEYFEIALCVPDEAYLWQVLLEGTREYGSYINVFYDEVQLEAVTLAADFYEDCQVNFLDFALLAANWLTDETEFDIAGETGTDGVVDLLDVMVLSEQWLAGP